MREQATKEHRHNRSIQIYLAIFQLNMDTEWQRRQDAQLEYDSYCKTHRETHLEPDPGQTAVDYNEKASDVDQRKQRSLSAEH